MKWFINNIHNYQVTLDSSIMWLTCSVQHKFKFKPIQKIMEECTLVPFKENYRKSIGLSKSALFHRNHMFHLHTHTHIQNCALIFTLNQLQSKSCRFATSTKNWHWFDSNLIRKWNIKKPSWQCCIDFTIYSIDINTHFSLIQINLTLTVWMPTISRLFVWILFFYH